MPARIEGQVLDAVTGAPIRKAVVTLTRKNARDYRPAEADTDASGRFHFTGIPPGEYTLAAGARGYLLLNQDSARQPRREGTLFTLAPAQDLSGLVLRLTPFGAVSGRILDQDGDPVAFVEVRVWHVTYRNWVRELTSDLDHKALTDDRGIFRIAGLFHGRYYLSATPPNRTAPNPQTARYVRTWHPGAFEPAGATPIDVASGVEQAIPNLKLSRIETVSLRGRVLAQVPANLLLSPDGLNPYGDVCTTFRSNPSDGAFAIDGLVPGAYRLLASTQEGASSATMHRNLTIGSTGIDNLTLQPVPSVAMEGRIRVEGTSDLTDLSKARVYFMPLYLNPALSSIQPPIKNGTFSLTSVIPGRYQLVVTNLPGNLYFRSAAIDLPPARPLEIVLHPNAAGVTGTVVLPDSEVSVPDATILLIPQETSRNDPFAYVKTTADSQGRFSIQSLPPGPYKAYAWSFGWPTIVDQLYFDPEFMRPFESGGVALSLGENDHPDVKLVLLSQ